MLLANPITWRPEYTEVLCSGITREWYHRRTIVAYRILATRSECYFAWAGYVVECLQKWPEDHPYLALHDVSATRVGLNYAAFVKYDLCNLGVINTGWKQLEPMIHDRPGFRARLALLFSMSHSGCLSRHLTEEHQHNATHRDRPGVQCATFFDKDRALRWLASGAQGGADSERRITRTQR